MLGLIKSFGSKAISSIPTFNSRSIINVPEDPNLEDKLNEISSKILKTQATDQFKIYQQLQSPQNSDFNRSLRKIYEYEGCKTEMINAIIRFYTFLLTNCKNELVICKLVSEPLVIELTKIVLQIKQGSSQQKEMMVSDCLDDLLIEKEKQDSEISGLSYENKSKQVSLVQSEESENDTNKLTSKNSQQRKVSQKIKSLHYLHDIDWDEVNAYKVAMIRSYINCINPQTIKYMIVGNQLPIFVNCVNGYKHYLTEGVQGTCISNCILMILTKVNHNDEVCEIIFDPEHHSKSSLSNDFKVDPQRQSLSKSISNQKSIKLHDFIKEVILKISGQLSKVLQNLQNQVEKMGDNFVEQSLKNLRKLDQSMEFIESNILFCVDLINSINNYNYTSKIKENIGESIQKELIGKIINYVEIHCSRKLDVNKSTPFHSNVLKLMRFVLNLSIACQKEYMQIQFLNKYSPMILDNLIHLNRVIFKSQEVENDQKDCEVQKIVLPVFKSQSSIQVYTKQCLTYLCNFTLILLKQTMSPYSKLASRKKLQISQEILQLKESILSKIFILLQQITKSQQLKERICFKSIRNLLLCVFFLTIKEDRCSLSPSSPQSRLFSAQKEQQSPTKDKQSPKKTDYQGNKVLSVSQRANLGLMLEFKYSILVLHKIFSQLFKKQFSSNKNWQFIVNNYESLMRQIPNNILSPQQSDKHCHYHNGNNYQEEDRMRDRIMICQAVRNYRYMIIDETKLEDRLIRLQNIYHKHFLSPGWNYHPGDTISFKSTQEYKIICAGLLHNNNTLKLPIQIIQDFQCLIITHKMSEHYHKVIANIRYKKINSFVPEGKNLIRMKLIGIQELILEFGNPKNLQIFKDYLNENRNKTREKELKFINYYLNLYLKDTEQLIEEIYNQQLVGLEQQTPKSTNSYSNSSITEKKLSFENIETQSFLQLDRDKIPEEGLVQNQDQQIDEQEQNLSMLEKYANRDLIEWEIKSKEMTESQEIEKSIDQIQIN